MCERTLVDRPVAYETHNVTNEHTHTTRWPPSCSESGCDAPSHQPLASAHQRALYLLCACVCVGVCIKWCWMQVCTCVWPFRVCAHLIKSPLLWGCICQPLPPLWSFELTALFERTSLISRSLCNQCPTGIQNFPRPCLPAASWRTIWESWPDEQAAGGAEDN